MKVPTNQQQKHIENLLSKVAATNGELALEALISVVPPDPSPGAARDGTRISVGFRPTRVARKEVM